MSEDGRQRAEVRGQRETRVGQKAETITFSRRVIVTSFRGGIMIRSFRDLKVYQQAFAISSAIFRRTRSFPREELYSLTDQVRRSSRSVAVNIAEGFAKRRFENVFWRHLIDAYGSCHETTVWLEIALES